MIGKLDLYKVFCEVVKCQSFSKAAKKLYMTQPAVSQSIMQLEGELDVRLFTRTSRGVVPTNEGQLLYEYVNSAINLINSGENKLQDIRSLMLGELKIGVSDTISRYFLLPYLEKFHNTSPGIKLKIINQTTIELCAMLKSGEIDIALCNLPVKDPSIEIKKCMEVQDVFVCGEKYKGILKSALNFKELSQLPLIFLDHSSNSRQYVENYILSKGVKITPDIELGSHDLLLDFARINLGIACVIREFSMEYLEKKLLYEVETLEAIPARGIGFCFPRGLSLSSASAKFVESVMGG